MRVTQGKQNSKMKETNLHKWEISTNQRRLLAFSPYFYKNAIFFNLEMVKSFNIMDFSPQITLVNVDFYGELHKVLFLFIYILFIIYSIDEYLITISTP